MFDVVITNPPYLSKQMVYLKFIKKSQDNATHVLGLHPVMPFLDQRNKNRWTETLNTFSKQLAYLRVIHSKNSFPDVDVQALLCISYWKQNVEQLIYENDLTDVKTTFTNNTKPDLYTNHLGYNDLFKRFWNIKKEDTISDWLIPRAHDLNEGWVVEVSLVRGNISNDKRFFMPDIFSFNPKNTKSKPSIDTKNTNKNKFWFKTEIEADNFCHYIDTNFARSTLAIVKRDYNPKFNKTPKVPLNKKWSDDELYKMFDLSKEEINFIEWLLKK